MRTNCVRFLLLAAICSSTSSVADTNAQYDAVKALGTLNGIALQCKHLDVMRRLKEAVVANAPKERSFGLAFDQATNDSFLAFLDAKAPCPSAGTLAAEADNAIAVMQQAFKPQ